MLVVHILTSLELTTCTLYVHDACMCKAVSTPHCGNDYTMHKITVKQGFFAAENYCLRKVWILTFTRTIVHVLYTWLKVKFIQASMFACEQLNPY